MDDVIVNVFVKLFCFVVFGVFIILVVFILIMILMSIEGKMFWFMVMIFSFVVLGVFLFFFMYVLVIFVFMFFKKIEVKNIIVDCLVNSIKKMYKFVFIFLLWYYQFVFGVVLVLFIVSVVLFCSLGVVFIFMLEEGDLVMQMVVQLGSLLQESICISIKVECVFLDNFLEVCYVVLKIGIVEVFIDFMVIEDVDIMIIFKDQVEWISVSDWEELVSKMKEELEVIVGVFFEFIQFI